MLNINITLIWGLIKFFTSRGIQETAETTVFKQRESKLEKRKRKTTEQELMEHDLPEAVLQMLG